MTEDEFRSRLEEKIFSMEIEERTHFMWRCAVIAFPLFGFRGSFCYWSEDRQKHIQSVVFSLDVSAASIIYMDAGIRGIPHLKIIAAVKEACEGIKRAEDGYIPAMVEPIREVAIEVAISTNAVSDSIDRVIRVAEMARYALDSDTIVRHPNWEEILIGDTPFPTPQEFYGYAWDKFIHSLDKAGCSYYGRLYTEIFQNQLKLDSIDKESLVRRVNLPEEIRAQGASTVCSYLEEMERRGAKSLNEARIIILGDKGAGKTSLARRLKKPGADMPEMEESTPGVDHHLWEIKKGDRRIYVRIWDFAGHTITHTIHRFFLSERCLYIIVFDGRREPRATLEYWLEHVKTYGGDADAIILVNEKDGHPPDIPVNLLKDRYRIVHDASFSIRDDEEGLKEFTEYVERYIADNTMWDRQQIPSTYFRVKRALEQKFEIGEPHIAKSIFTNIAIGYGVDNENIEHLMRALHNLGISLWYGEIAECRDLILDPQWISYGIYGAVNWAYNKKKAHTLSLGDFAEIFSSGKDKERYPETKYRELFELMKYYELAYGTGKGASEKLVIPHILPEDRPDPVPDFPVGESLMLRYSADPRLPPNVTSRFIVKHHRDIHYDGDKPQVWRYGVVLGKENTTALVREDGRILSVSVKGPKRTELVATLRESLNGIFETYKREAPELEYRIDAFGKTEVWASESEVDSLFYRGEDHTDNKSGKKTPILEIAENYGIVNYVHQNIQNTFHFRDSTINLQGSLKELAASVKKEAPEEAEWLEETATLLQKAESCETPDDVKRNGIGDRLWDLACDLRDPDSRLHKVLSNVRNGVKKAQKIGRLYNSIAQCVGFPQIPVPFLGRERR